ncbi:hypothetical protein Sjap_012931 [Stephania japonica]|uniref:Uncharacterized protein n=1 Tax=Stephania japonica TaxID=461633 RepID=A0AAP0IX32_9MAGN
MTIFEYLGTNEKYIQLFTDITFSHTTILMRNILDKYKGFDDEKLKVVVDLGGGDDDDDDGDDDGDDDWEEETGWRGRGDGMDMLQRLEMLFRDYELLRGQF